MNNPEKNNAHSKRLTFKMICLTFCVVIMMTATGMGQNFTTTISNNGSQKIVSTFPMNDLLSFTGTPNSIYHEAIKTCSKITQFMIKLYFNDSELLKSPPLVAATMNRYSKKIDGIELIELKGTSILVNLKEPLKFTMCSDHVSLLELAKSTLLTNESTPPMNLNFSISYTGKRSTQIMKTVSFEFASILVAVFYEPPACLLVDDLSYQIFWSDTKQGIIRAYDPAENIIMTLVNSLTMPKSMVIDSSVKLLFWCNFEFVGSIERINFNGNNRIKITEEIYDLHYPDTLGIDYKNQMLYWVADKVIHTSDYDGNLHKIVKKSESFNPNIPRCITFTNAVEYNFFWEKPQVPYYERSFAPNNLLSISYQKNDEEEYDAEKLSAGLRVQILQQKNWSTSHMCREIALGYHCVLQLVPFNKYIKVSQMLSKAGFKPMKLSEISNFHPKHEKLLSKVESFYFNSKIRNAFYYDVETKNIRFISCLEEHPIDIIKNVILPINGFTYSGINHSIYYINVTENNILLAKLDSNNYPETTEIAIKNNNNGTIVGSLTINVLHNRFIDNKLYILNNTDKSSEQFDLDETNNPRLKSPYIYSYPTQYMDYKNNAQITAMRKQFLYGVFDFFFSTFT